ncbi:L-rhamnose isomerase [Sphingobacterium daejeonense]|jgi:L-rhamnose isomerase/sugar isomerase|nr:L-rhamnose isomerase [Sphingobacterium daejeonense]
MHRHYWWTEKLLKKHKKNNDIVKAQNILQNAFRTDVRPIVAEARLRAGAALDPLQLFDELAVREQLVKERGENSVATGL